MISFRYRAREASGAQVTGLIDAEDRRAALGILAERGLFPSRLDEANGTALAPAPATPVAVRQPPASPAAAAAAPAKAATGRISRKEISAFTREMATLLAATIPIPAALQGLGEEEENPALKAVILSLASAVRSGVSFSGALEHYPRLFPKLYTSMVQVGEESGALDKVLTDLADLMEHEDEVRGEVLGAVAYPAFVLGLGILTTCVLLVFVLPRLLGMFEGMMDALPLPTRILFAISDALRHHWPWLLGGAAALILIVRWWLRTPAGALARDTLKLRLPIVGSVFRAAALGRFARTLGTLAGSGVSLLPAIEITRNTVGNRHYAGAIARVAEETRGGDSLAAPLRKHALFPPTMVQMIAVGEETGRLDQMLLRVAHMQERIVRGRARTLISLLAPVLILVVGALVGFIVIALLLPIFQMSQMAR
jgi:type II secretory pathway component PulF